MTKEEIVRDLLAQMRVALANEDGLPQSYVNSRVLNISTFLATQVQVAAQSDPATWLT